MRSLRRVFSFSPLDFKDFPHMDLGALTSTSFLLLARNLNFSTPIAEVSFYLFLVLPSLFLLPVVSTISFCLIFLLHYSLSPHPGIFLPKKKKKKKGKKFSKCLSLYCKLWATVVHSRGTLGNYVVRSKDENSLRGYTLPNKPRYADQVTKI
jgi:hypothetical protein